MVLFAPYRYITAQQNNYAEHVPKIHRPEIKPNAICCQLI